jgi:hypothetical protein
MARAIPVIIDGRRLRVEFTDDGKPIRVRERYNWSHGPFLNGVGIKTLWSVTHTRNGKQPGRGLVFRAIEEAAKRRVELL